MKIFQIVLCFLFYLKFELFLISNCSVAYLSTLIEGFSNNKKEEKSDKSTIELNSELKNCLEFLISSGQFDLVKSIILQGLNEYNISTLKLINDLKSKLRAIDNKISRKLIENGMIKVVNPAFKWAQSKKNIFLEIKFSSKINSPGISNLLQLKANFDDQNLYFCADVSYEETFIRFKLDLKFLHFINSELSFISENSVGRVNVNITKLIPGEWERLLQKDEKISNMHIWWEIREKYKDEIRTQSDNEYEPSPVLPSSFFNLEKDNKTDQNRTNVNDSTAFQSINHLNNKSQNNKPLTNN